MKEKKVRKRITAKAVQETENTEVVKRITATAITKEPDDDAIEDDGLTMRQRLFVRFITGKHLGNATRSAIAAGYRENSAQQTASENLSKPVIQAAIRAALAKKHGGPDWVVQELTAIAGADFSQFVTVQEDGRPRIDWAKAAASGALGSIKELSFDPVTGDPKLKTHDRVRALDTLARIHGLVRERHEVTGPGGGPVQVAAMATAQRIMSDPAAYAAALELSKRLGSGNVASAQEVKAEEVNHGERADSQSA